ncbi:MAG: LysR family transcriptional regulator [Bacteroidales bacterium]|nr:LysR family transcriptional regulator [Lentimicrobiaceae bacterium]MDD5696240.1 LysR family transcriptional regulator [Bacteroidales bacterium]
MNEKYNNIHLQYKIWLESDDGKGILGDGKWQILKAIKQEGSLMAACAKLGIAYRKTWDDLKKIEQMLGFKIIQKTRGGKEGGNTILSDEGIRLVEAFDHFHSNLDGLIQEKFRDMLSELKN